jgi:ribosomal protein S18 acetylase RimI-like enzyme
MRAIQSPAGLPSDPMLRWAAQSLSGGARAWSSEDGRAFAVAAPALARHDLLAVGGPADALGPLVQEVRAEVGPGYRPVGDRALISALAASVPGLAWEGDFGWMDRTGDGAGTMQDTTGTLAGAGRDSALGAGRNAGKPAWLTPSDEPEITALLSVASPAAWATPGGAGVERWAGIRGDGGRLIAVAADAWSAPTVGFLAGIAVHPEARGLGLGKAVSVFAMAEALLRYGTAALLVDEANTVAIALYRRLGMSYRPMSAAGTGHP